MIKLYLGGQFEHRHEVDQFNEILRTIENNQDKIGDFAVIFGSVYAEGEEIDTLIFMEDSIIVIEMKSWVGKINGSENGDWGVDNHVFRNVFSYTVYWTLCYKPLFSTRK